MIVDGESQFSKCYGAGQELVEERCVLSVGGAM